MNNKVPAIQAAEELLEKTGKPLHYMEVTRLILARCALSGRTPQESVRSVMSASPKFVRVAEGIYALSKWKKYKPARFAKDIAYDILKTQDKPVRLVDLGQKIFEERKFVGDPKVVARNAIRNDQRFMLDRGSELVSLSEWE